MRRPKLLLAGGGHADIPLIQAAQALGYHVVSTGNRASDLGHRYSDEYVPEDYSNREAMLRLAERLGIDAICACCNDFSALSAAYVAESLELPGHDPYQTARVIHEKDRYRAFAQDHGVATPRAEGFRSTATALDALDGFDLPVLVKPVDLTGGKGITRIDRVEDARSALETAFQWSRANRVVVEEFLVGSRHGLSVFLRDGRVVFHFNDNEHYFQNPYLVSAASTPGQVPDGTIEKLCVTSEHIASVLSLKTGIFHIQYIVHGGEPVIVEICRRAPGDLYVSLVRHATGVDYASWIVRASCGLDCSELEHADPSGFFTRHCVMPERAGIVSSVSVDPSIAGNIIDDLMWWQPGDVVEDVMTHKLGIVFMRFDSMAQMLDQTERMPDLIRAEFRT